MVAEEEEGDPECREGLEDEDGDGLLLLLLDEGEGVEDEGFGGGDGGAEPQYLTGDGHGGPQGVRLPDFGCEVVVEIGLGIEADLVDGGEVLGEVLDESAELRGEEGTFSRPPVWARRVMRDSSTLVYDVINESIMQWIVSNFIIHLSPTHPKTS